jgi:putative inorganic carbon (hco3(-)) transporter
VLATRSFARLAAVLSFAYILRGEFFGVPYTALELCLLAVLVAYVVEKLYSGEAFPDPRRMPYFWPLALLVLAATISVLVAPDKRAAAGIWKAYFVEPALVAMVLWDVLRTPGQVHELIGAFFTAGIIVSVFELLAFLYALGIHRPRLVEDPVVVLYFTANATGLFLGPLLAIAGAFLLFGDNAQRFRGAFFSVFALPAFILSFSRGAWLALVLASLLLIWQHRRRLILSAALAATVVVALLVPPIRRRIQHQFDPNDPLNSAVLRAHLWKATLQMQANPRHLIFGTGLSGFKHDIQPYKNFAGYTEDLIYPHNILLNFWTETGLLGVAAFAWLAVAWTRNCWSRLRRPGPARVYFIGLAAASVTILVHGMLDVPFFKNDLAFLTLALVGMQAALIRQEA